MGPGDGPAYLKLDKSEDIEKAEDGQVNVERNSPEREDRHRNIAKLSFNFNFNLVES